MFQSGGGPKNGKTVLKYTGKNITASKNAYEIKIIIIQKQHKL